MAVNPITLLNGTTAYASDVETKVNPLYSSIDNSNISAAAGIVFSKLDSATVASIATAQNLQNKTFTTLTGFTLGLYVSATQKIFADGGGDTYIQESSANTLDFVVGGSLAIQLTTAIVALGARDFIVTATQKIRLDGSASGDTYLYESSANNVDLYVGGTRAMQWTTTYVALDGLRDFLMPALARIRLDGAAGGDTYLYESAANIVDLYVGNTLAMEWTTTFVALSGSRDLIVPALNKIRIDGSSSGDTYLYESAANIVDLYVGNTLAMEWTTTFVTLSGSRDFIMPAANKVRLDGSSTGDTYLYERIANTVDLYTGGVLAMEWTSTYVSLSAQDFIIPNTLKLRLDGNAAGDTYISETSANVVDHYAGGTLAMTVTSSGIKPVTADPPTANFLTAGAIPKAWAALSINAAGNTATTIASYNMSSATCAAYVTTINFNTDFASASICPVANISRSAGTALMTNISVLAAGSIQLFPYDAAGAAWTNTHEIYVVVYGTQ